LEEKMEKETRRRWAKMTWEEIKKNGTTNHNEDI